MRAGVKTRLLNRAKALALSRRLDGVLGLLALPVRQRRGGVNPVVGDYYGMLVGRSFDSDDAAAEHYFRDGWKLGVIPTPFLHVPAARVSTAMSFLLRHELARVARGAEPRGRIIGDPAKMLQLVDIGQLVGSRGGWLAELTRRLRADPSSQTVVLGVRTVVWRDYLASCRALVDASRTVVSSGIIDRPLYQSQVGGYVFLSDEAALDDYIDRGELDGRLLTPFFEGEWYEASERSQVRRGRPANQLLDFVARGEVGQAGPHFWGKVHLDRLGDGARPASLLAHFTATARADELTPASEGVAPVTRATAERVARESVENYHRDLGRLTSSGPLARRHREVPVTPAPEGTCLVVVDERHIRSSAAVAELRRAADQAFRGSRFVIVESDGVARRSDLQELVDTTLSLDLLPRAAGETFGAAAARALADSPAEAWAQWTPRQRWHRGFLAAAVGTLRASKDAAAVAFVNGGLPQAWLTTDDPTWLEDLDAGGVVFRAPRVGGPDPDAKLDLGLVFDLVLRIGLAGRAVSVRSNDVVRLSSADVSAHEDRAAANAARSKVITDWSVEARDAVGVVIPTYEDWHMTAVAVRRVLDTSGEAEIVVVDNGSRRSVTTILASAFAAEPRVRVVRLPRNTDFATGSNYGASLARARTTVFLNNDTAVLAGWLDPLAAALQDESIAAAQPLLLFGDRTVQTAGTIFLGGMTMPRHLYVDVHPSDVDGSLDEYEFSALTAACLAVRFDDLAAVGGFDAGYINGMEDVDLCLRLKRHTGASLRVRTTSRVVHFESRTAGRHTHQMTNRDRFAERWRRELVEELDDRAVFDTGRISLDDIVWSREAASPLWTPQLVLGLRRPAVSVKEATPRLRWAIKSSATGDLAGDSWGDTFFAADLAKALERLGQDVVVDRSSSHARDTGSWDDVTLALRGLARYIPQPGLVNLLWVISHPDLVTKYELESGFDRVYAAGRGWADFARDRWGADVSVLLQATDATKFNPSARTAAERAGTIFVGRTRGVARPIVTDVIAAGGRPEVYGDDGWEQFIDPAFLAGSGMDNDDVPTAYANAGIVLNDHWRDMAEFGFFSNRLFDAAAVGARVVSDQVPGMAEVFGRQVQSYASLDELRLLLDPHSEAWPREDALTESAHRVVAEHSFDRRARTLLDDALAIRKERRA
ncbi:glycosyltransferase [Microbacterium sp. NPDC057407]|uniref:glycosyltransferase n=1 Tax=Microbacterium sp. NPDC057407 TaxID=3346120 RepID=UPI0036713045